MPVKRIVLATFGSLGDLHPYLGLALALKRAGHAPLIVSADVHRQAVEIEGIEFAPMRPGVAQLGDIGQIVRRLLHPVTGPRYLIRDMLMPYLRESYADLDRACTGADLLLTHPLAFAGPLIAEKRRLRWASSVLAPLSLMSAIDPPQFPSAPWLGWARGLGIGPYRALFGAIKRIAGGWEKPLAGLRAELGLPAPRGFAQFEGQYSPALNLALFSRVLAEPQADWPQNTVLCGFARYDGAPLAASIRAGLDAFLAAGTAPIVFTLGSSVALHASDFFVVAADAAQRLGRRAILITGQDPAAFPGLPATIRAFRYLPYSVAFPHAAVTVHQGGIGTLAQALAAGRPQLIAPAAFDQPDNARRAARAGVARVLPFRSIRLGNMVEQLDALLGDPGYALRAKAVAQTVREEERGNPAVELLTKDSD